MISKLLKRNLAWVTFSLLFASQAYSAPGDVLTSFSSPEFAPSGLAWRDGSLYQVYHGTRYMHKINSATGEVETTLPAYQRGGLTFAENFLWASDPVSDVITKIDPVDGFVHRSFSSPGSDPAGLAFDGSYLWHVDGVSNTIYQLNPIDGSTVNSFTSPASKSYGITWDGSSLWVADSVDDLLYQINPSDGSVIKTLPAPATNPQGLTWDGTQLWVNDGDTERLYRVESGVAFDDVLGCVDVKSRGLKGEIILSQSGETDQNASFSNGCFAFASIASGEPFQLSIQQQVATDGTQLEAGRVVLNDSTGTFNQVNFQQTYDLVPLVFVLNTSDNGQPAEVRIRNVTTSGFEVAQLEADGGDGVFGSTTIDYFAIEPGQHTLPDGTLIDAGSVDTNATVAHSSVGITNTWEIVRFNQSFAAAPALMVQVQTMNNEPGSAPGTPSMPFLTSAVDNLSATQVSISMERAEVASGSANENETVAYVAIESGAAGSFQDVLNRNIDFEAFTTADALKGVGNGSCVTTSFSNSYAAPLVVATQVDRAGNNGGWVRRCSLDGSSVGLWIDEDTYNDSERKHTTEPASVFVFSDSFSASF